MSIPTSVARPLRFVTFMMLLIAGSAKLSAITLREFFDRYVGTWEGVYRISSPNSSTVRVLSAKHEYSWVGDRLFVMATYEDREGIVTYEDAQIFVYTGEGDLKGSLVKQVSHANPNGNLYVGQIRRDAISWLPANVLDAKSSKFVEAIDATRSQPILRISGYRHTLISGVPVKLIVEGNLAKSTLMSQ